MQRTRVASLRSPLTPTVRPPGATSASFLPSEVRLTRFVLGDTTTLDLPDFLHARIEDDGALLAIPAGSATVELRVSTLTMSLPDRPAPLAGVEFVVAKAREIGVPLQVHGTASWYSTPGPPDSALHLWIAGMGAHVLIASLFIDPATPEDPDAARLFTSLPPILASWQTISAA